MQLAALFDSALVGQRDDVAVEVDGAGGRVDSLTFGELDARSNRLARVLASRGVVQGDRVAIYLANRLEYIDAVLACLKLGAVLVPINVLYRDREIMHIVADAEPRAVLTTGGALDSCRGTAIWDIDQLTAASAGESPARVRNPIDGDAPAAIVYTSGTTGRSKGAVLSQDRKSTRLNSSHLVISYAVFCLKKKR